MTPDQINALTRPVRSNRELAAVLQHPQRYELGLPHTPRQAWVTLAVVADGVQLVWNASVRIFSDKHKKLRPTSSWTLGERSRATEILENEVRGVGDFEPHFFETKFGMYISKQLTAQEQKLVTPVEQETDSHGTPNNQSISV